MSNAKDICPICGINEKGVKSKSCRPCALKKLTKPGPTPAEPKPAKVLETEAKTEAKTDTKSEEEALKAEIAILKAEAEALKAKADQAAVDAMFSSDPTLVPELNPELEPTLSPALAPAPTPSTVGQTTPDGKYYI